MPSIKDYLKSLTGVDIEINDIQYPNSFAEDLFIDRTNLDGEFAEHAERFAYYATMAELAENRHNQLAEELKNLEARIDHEKRAQASQLAAADAKFKMTEKMFEHEIRLDKRFLEKQKEVQDARYLAKVLKNAPMAFSHRRDMLIELAKQHTAGMTSPRVVRARTDEVRQIIKNQRDTNVSPPPTIPSPVTEPSANGRRRTAKTE